MLCLDRQSSLFRHVHTWTSETREKANERIGRYSQQSQDWRQQMALEDEEEIPFFVF